MRDIEDDVNAKITESSNVGVFGFEGGIRRPRKRCGGGDSEAFAGEDVRAIEREKKDQPRFWIGFGFGLEGGRSMGVELNQRFERHSGAEKIRPRKVCTVSEGMKKKG